MKNIIRAFALSLVVTGAIASTQISNASAQTSVATRVSAVPVPTCPPDDPNGCGIGSIGK